MQADHHTCCRRGRLKQCRHTLRQEATRGVDIYEVRNAAADLPSRRLATAAAGADAIFISCTGLRAVDAVAPLEAETSMPVVTSNQAMA